MSIEGFNNEENYAPERSQPPTEPPAAECDNCHEKGGKHLVGCPVGHELDFAPTSLRVHTASPFKTSLVQFANAAVTGDETRFAESRDQILGRHDNLIAVLHQVVDWYEGRVHNGPRERTQMYEAAKQALAGAEEGEA